MLLYFKPNDLRGIFILENKARSFGLVFGRWFGVLWRFCTVAHDFWKREMLSGYYFVSQSVWDRTLLSAWISLFSSVICCWSCRMIPDCCLVRGIGDGSSVLYLFAGVVSDNSTYALSMVRFLSAFRYSSCCAFFVSLRYESLRYPVCPASSSATSADATSLNSVKKYFLKRWKCMVVLCVCSSISKREHLLRSRLNFAISVDFA